jgi:DNA polymerase-3 subunit delta'
MAQAWICQQSPAAAEYCGECAVCRGIERGASPDLHVLQPEEQGAAIRVEVVRELERQISLAPYGGRGRVAILDSFQLASEGATNALLKTLEEPPPRVLLLLTAPSSEELLPTVVSRCEVIRLRPVAKAAIASALQAEGASAAEAHGLAEQASGRPGWALRLFRDSKWRQARDRSLKEMFTVLHSGRSDRLAYAEKLIRRGKDLDSYEARRSALVDHLEPWAAALRRAMRRGLGVKGESPAEEDGLGVGRGKEMVRAVQALERVGDAFRRNGHLQMNIESLLLELPYLPSAEREAG